MQTKIMAKVAAVATGLAMATSMLSLAPMAHAASLTTTQVNAILSLLSSFGADAATLANVTAALNGTPSTGGGTSATGGACSVGTADLKLGSTGAGVVGLQTGLVAGGYLVMPAGVAMGNFGPLTQAAVVAWQKAAGISPAAGYFGPISRAAFNLCGTAVTPPGTTPPPGTVGTEGSFTVSQDAQPANNTAVVSNTNTPVYGIKIKATGSDMTIDRFDLQSSVTIVTINGSTVNPGSFITSVSAYDGSTLLKTMALSTSDFTKDSDGVYYVRISGIGFKVPKDTTKTLTFKVNTNSVGSTDYTKAVTVVGYATDNVRGLDTAGFNTYADATWTSSFTFTATNNAVLTGTASTDTPAAQSIAINATDGAKGVVMQKFKLKATTGDATLTDLRVYVKTDSGTYSDPTSLYLYDGDTLLGSAAVSVTAGSGAVDFSNMEYVIAKDVTKTLTVKADFPTTATGVASTTIATAAAETNTTMIETPDGTSKEVAISTAMTGSDMHLRVVSAAHYSLVSANIAHSAGVANIASSTLTGTIVLDVKAEGGLLTKPTAGMFSVWFASSTPAKTTNGGTAYSAANAITVASPTVTVTPNVATIGDGETYRVTIVGNLLSSNALFGAATGSGYNEFMAIESIDTTMDPTGGSVTDQNWGVDTFYTPSALLTKGTL